MEVAKWRVGEPHRKSPNYVPFVPLFSFFAQWRGSNGGCEMDVYHTIRIFATLREKFKENNKTKGKERKKKKEKKEEEKEKKEGRKGADLE